MAGGGAVGSQGRSAVQQEFTGRRTDIPGFDRPPEEGGR